MFHLGRFPAPGHSKSEVSTPKTKDSDPAVIDGSLFFLWRRGANGAGNAGGPARLLDRVVRIWESFFGIVRGNLHLEHFEGFWPQAKDSDPAVFHFRFGVPANSDPFRQSDPTGTPNRISRPRKPRIPIRPSFMSVFSCTGYSFSSQGDSAPAPAAGSAPAPASRPSGPLSH